MLDREREEALKEIARRLKLERPLAFLDLETTGTAVDRDRIVEIAVVTVEPYDLEPFAPEPGFVEDQMQGSLFARPATAPKRDYRVRRFHSLVNPGIPIPPEATAVHHIGDADVKDAPLFTEIATEVVGLVTQVDLAGFNLRRFDLKMIAAELARASLWFNPEEARVVDAMSIFHQNEKRDLGAAVRFYCSRGHDGHRAEEDVLATIDVLRAQLDRYREVLPVEMHDLDEYCRGRKPDWLSSDGKFVWRENAARISFGKHNGKSLETLAKEDPGYLRWIADDRKREFADDTRKLAGGALQGQFPLEPAARKRA
jgi:DNA polymerase III subunit epsilon